MKKYNRSEIMKNAWKKFNLRRKSLCSKVTTFAECLKEAWAFAKEEAAKKEKVARLGNYFTTVINFCEVTINRCDNIISGDTYKLKNILKKYGFKWNSFERYWENGNVNDLIADVIA